MKKADIIENKEVLHGDKSKELTKQSVKPIKKVEKVSWWQKVNNW